MLLKLERGAAAARVASSCWAPHFPVLRTLWCSGTPVSGALRAQTAIRDNACS